MWDVRKKRIVGAIAFGNFAKEAPETFVQFFSFLFDNVVVETLVFCPRFPDIHLRFFDCIFVYCLFGKPLYFFTGNCREFCRHFFSKQKQKCHCVHCCHGNFLILSIFCCYTTIKRKWRYYQPMKSQIRIFSPYIIR